LKLDRHRCGIPECRGWVNKGRVICVQHSVLIGWELAVRLQTAWQERKWGPEWKARYLKVRHEALERLKTRLDAKGHDATPAP
jgi:hypothetical protein